MCVLLVEDDLLLRELMMDCLQSAGFTVEEAATGDEAVRMISDHSEQFEALVTDLQMPGPLDGSEVAAAIRRLQPRIPVIIMSGRPDLFSASWHSDLGYGLVSKPFRPFHLIELVRRLLTTHPDTLACISHRGC